MNLREGQYRIRLKDNKHGPGKAIRNGDCSYPAVEIFADGAFVVTTYGHWDANEEPYILSVRFTLSEIDARAGDGLIAPSTIVVDRHVVDEPTANPCPRDARTVASIIPQHEVGIGARSHEPSVFEAEDSRRHGGSHGPYLFRR